MTITSSCGTLTHHRWPGRLRRTRNKTSSADQGWDDDGICDECFGQTFVTDGQRFRGHLTRKKRQTTAAARQHALSYLNDSRRTCTGRKGDVGNTAEKGKGVFLSWKTWWSIEYCEFEDVHLKRKSSFPCCVQLKLTKLFIHMDICFRSLPIQKKREKGEKQWFWRVAEVVFVTSVSQSQCHFFSRYYSCHPCFLLYCSISECCCLVYGLDMCERRRCESQYGKMLYFCYEIY